jgi:hypothetical protein
MAGGVRVTVFGAEAIREARASIMPDLEHVGEQIVADARASAPVRRGDYRDGVELEVSGDQVRVVDNDPAAGFKEYGTSDTPAHATLTDAARRYGKYSGVQPKGRRRR